MHDAENNHSMWGWAPRLSVSLLSGNTDPVGMLLMKAMGGDLPSQGQGSRCLPSNDTWVLSSLCLAFIDSMTTVGRDTGVRHRTTESACGHEEEGSLASSCLSLAGYVEDHNTSASRVLVNQTGTKVTS